MAASFPGWVMLDRFAVRREFGWYFPDEETAPLRGSTYTSQDHPVSVAFRLAEPPAISRLYLHWPARSMREHGGECCTLVAAHRNLLLFRLVNFTDNPAPAAPFMGRVVDYFICRASSSSSPPLLLKRIPMCTEPMVFGVNKKGKEITMPRVFFFHSVGLLCRGEEEFAVAQLGAIKVIPQDNKLETEVCVLRSLVSDDHHADDWEVIPLEIKHAKDEFSALNYWCVEAVIPFKDCMCFVDYYRGGILFYDAFREGRPGFISYLRLPIRHYPEGPGQRNALHKFSRRLCVTKGGDVLKFVDIVRDDGEFIGPLKPGSGFTIISHSLTTLSTSKRDSWEKDYEITSDQLWDLNTSTCLPHEILMFPLVSMDKPHLVHFLIPEPPKEIEKYPQYKISTRLWRKDKVSVVTIDTSTKLVVSAVPYVQEIENLYPKDAGKLMLNDSDLEPFFPTELPMFLNFTRKRKHAR